MLHTIRLSALIILLATTGLQAQKVPGYLGKRLSLGYTGHYALTLNALNYTSDVNDDGTDGSLLDGEYTPRIQATHFLSGEYVLGKQYSLTLGFGFNRSYSSASELRWRFEDYDNNRQVMSFPSRIQINSFQIAAGLRVYSALYAPIGRFTELYASFQRSSISDFDIVYMSSQGIFTENMTPPAATSGIVGIKFGRARMIRDIVRFEYFGGIGFQYPGFLASNTAIFSGEENIELPESITEGNTEETDRYFQRLAEGRTFINNFIYVGITVGIMP